MAAPIESARSWLTLFAILAVTAFLYLPSLSFQFVYDDRFQIMRNPRLTSWSYVPGYFAHHVWFHLASAGTYYRPLFLIWLRLNYLWFAQRPLGWHVTTLGLHLAATALVYLLLHESLSSSFVANFATAVFALHPVHIESVAWVSGLTDALMAIPLLSCLLCWITYYRHQKVFYQFAALIFLILALLAKESAMIAPWLIAAYAFVLNSEESISRRLRRASAAAAPFFGVFLVFWLIRRRIIAPELMNSYHGALAPLANFSKMAGAYLWHLVWPSPLSLYYDISTLPTTVSRAVAGAFSLAVVIAVGILAARRSRELFLAWVWTMLPIGSAVGGVMIFARFDSFHDRYLYLATIGFGIFVGHLLAQIRGGPICFGRPALRVILGLCILSNYAFSVILQESYWRDNFTLFARTTAVAPNNPMAYTHLGRETDFLNDTQRAYELYAKAASLDPNDFSVRVALGALSLQRQDWNAALAYCRSAIHIAPLESSDCYRIETRAFIHLSDIPNAEATIRFAIAHWPAQAGEHLLLAEILATQGHSEQAREEFLTELLLDPSSPEAHGELTKLSP